MTKNEKKGFQQPKKEAKKPRHLKQVQQKGEGVWAQILTLSSREFCQYPRGVSLGVRRPGP